MMFYFRRPPKAGWIVFFLLLTGICTPVFAGAPERPDKLVRVRVHLDAPRTPEQPAEMEKLVSTLLQGEMGRAPDSERILEIADLLKTTGRFSKIHLDLEPCPGGQALVVRLTLNQRVTSIVITGEGPVFKKDILHAMSLSPGSPFSAADLGEQKRRILKLYENQGFSGTTVEVASTGKPDDPFADIQVNIRPGRYYRLGRLVFENNTAFSDEATRLKMATAASSLLPGAWGRFVANTLAEDLKKLTERYWEKGYFEAKITHTLETDKAGGRVNVKIQVDPGPLYETEFTGNTYFSDRKLKTDLLWYTRGLSADPGFSRSRLAMEKRYKKAGFASVGISISQKPVNGSGSPALSRRLVVKVDEGVRTMVSSVTINGATVFTRDEIGTFILTGPKKLFHKGIFDEEVLKEDVRAIEAAYLKAGYPHAKASARPVFSADRSFVRVVFDIREGPACVISDMGFAGLSAVGTDQARQAMKIKPGDKFRAYEISHEENRLAALVSEKGYPYVTVSAETKFSPDQKQAKLVFHVDQGPFVRVGTIRFAGNLKTATSVLQKALAVSEGAPFSLKAVNLTEKNIRNLNLFDYARIKAPGLTVRARTVDLFVEVREKAPYGLEAGLGYDTRRHFYVHSKIKDQNLSGTGKSLWLGGELSEIGHRAEAGISEPRLMGSPVSAALSLYSEKTQEFNQVFGAENHGLSLTLERHFQPVENRRVFASFSVLAERRDQFSTNDITGEQADDEDFSPRNRLVVTPSVRYDSRDSFIRPKKGMTAFGAVDVSKGLGSSLDDFVKPSADVRWYRSVLPWVTFAVMGRAGHIYALGNETQVPMDQLFYLGGTGSVRGFAENKLRVDENNDPAGGLTFASASLEARVDLGGNFELTLFYDTGVITDVPDSSGSDDPRSSVGLGLRYITPVGPVGLMYGHKLDRKSGEESGRFHFSLGYTF